MIKRMARQWIVVILALAALPLGVTSAAQSGGVEAGREEAVGVLVKGLEKLADWCQSKKLFLERNNIFNEILEYAPDNEKAHKGLKHKKNRKSGQWEEAKNPKPPKNMGKGAIDDLPARRKAAVKPFVDQLLALLRAGEGQLSADSQRAILGDIFRVDPENDDGHRIIGDVQLDGVWVLPETARAVTRRKALRRFIRTKYEETPEPEQGDLRSRDQEIGLAWTQVVRSRTVRVVGTGDAEEARQAARAVSVAQDYFNGVFESSATFPDGFTVYLLADSENEKAIFLDGHPEAASMNRALLEPLDGSGFGKSNDFAHWSSNAERRIDATVHFSICWLTQKAFRISSAQGWVYEGLGLYMTNELLGTRLNWFVLPSSDLDPEADAELRGKLLDPETDWMSSALEILASEERPRLSDVVRKSANQMSAADMLIGYVTVAFLVEAMPPEWTIDFLQAIGRNRPVGASSKEFLRMSLDELDERVVRWLGERR